MSDLPKPTDTIPNERLVDITTRGVPTWDEATPPDPSVECATPRLAAEMRAMANELLSCRQTILLLRTDTNG